MQAVLGELGLDVFSFEELREGGHYLRIDLGERVSFPVFTSDYFLDGPLRACYFVVEIDEDSLVSRIFE